MEIENYYKSKERKVKLEKLLAWKDFYQKCKNERLVARVERQIERL